MGEICLKEFFESKLWQKCFGWIQKMEEILCSGQLSHLNIKYARNSCFCQDFGVMQEEGKEI